MKYKIAFGILALAAIAFIIYKWRSSGKEIQLEGRWSVDSIHVGADSNMIYTLFYASIQGDSSSIDLDFNRDTLLTFFNEETDTTVYHFDKKENQLVIKSDADETYAVGQPNDSMITLTAKDSTILYLKNIKRR